MASSFFLLWMAGTGRRWPDVTGDHSQEKGSIPERLYSAVELEDPSLSVSKKAAPEKVKIHEVDIMNGLGRG